MASLLGIDNGLTVTKAVVFDAGGRQLAVARRRVPQSMPRPHFVERDMDGLWRATAEAIAEALARAGRPASDIAAVAATAHGDGLYLLDAATRPLGPGILSLDSRANETVARWTGTPLMEQALALTGQHPHVSAPSALLAWIRDEEPDRYARIAHVFACKDWLRFCLTGTIGTDRTEASTSFTDVRTQDYAPDALALYGLDALAQALPPIAHSAEIVGHVTPEAAALTGLAEGTPVAAGLHDVTASAHGIGAHRPGVAGIVAGTYSINEVVSDKPLTDPRWFARNAIEPGLWNNMSISPASAANYDWFLDTLCARDREAGDIHALLAPEIDAALARPSSVIYHPFLFGSPHGTPSSAGFFGLHGWHQRGDMLRAVLEGIAFNHRTHIEALRDGFPFAEARLTGGISRNPAFVQLFADILGLPVTVTETEEAAAWGAALCAGAAAGLYASAADDPRDLSAISTTCAPDPGRHAAMTDRFRLFTSLAEALKPHWAALDALG
jgi:L-xylulokinase